MIIKQVLFSGSLTNYCKIDRDRCDGFGGDTWTQMRHGWCRDRNEIEMNHEIKTGCPIVLWLVLFSGSVVAQVAQTVDEVEALLFTSNLEQIARSEGAKGKVLELEVIQKILAKHEDALVGGISDFSKFATLKELCSNIEVHSERKHLEGELFRLFKKVGVIQGKPKNWNEELVKSEGGPLGLVTKCLLVSSGKEMRSKVLDYVIEADQFAKTKLLLEKVEIAGERKEFAGLVVQKAKAARSKKMEALLHDFSNKASSKNRPSSSQGASGSRPSHMSGSSAPKAPDSEPSDRRSVGWGILVWCVGIAVVLLLGTACWVNRFSSSGN